MKLMNQELSEQTQENWKMKVMVIGGLMGLVTGLAAAYLLVQRAEKAQEQPLLNSSEGVKLGLLVFGLLRQVSQLGEGK
jgi:hypothetical protein